MEPVISVSGVTGTVTIMGCTTSMGTVLVCTILLEAFMPFTQAVSMVVVFMAAEGIAEPELNELSLRIASWIDSEFSEISITLWRMI
jgi:hypothetical protein